MRRLLMLSILFFYILLSLSRCALFLNDDGFSPLKRQMEDGLPIFYIHPIPVTTEYCPVSIYYKGEEFSAKARKRGNTSLSYPMNSYTLKFYEDHLFYDSEYQFYNKREIVLITSFDDNSYIRHRLAYDIWNRIDINHIQIKTYNAVVYLNGQYWGLYTVAEHINGYLMADHGLNRFGDIYKGTGPEADFYIKQNLHEEFLKIEGYPEDGDQGAYTVLDEFVEFIGNSNSEDFLARVNSILRKKEYEDWWIYITFILASDCCSKNAHHYLDSGNGVWRFIPWDLNYSFGQDWKTYRTNCDRKSNYFNQNNIFNRFFQEVTIFEPLKTRYIDYLSTGNVFDIDWIINKIDEYYDEIRTAALKNEQKWSDLYREFYRWSDRENFTTFEEEIQYIKNWINNRHIFLLEKFLLGEYIE